MPPLRRPIALALVAAAVTGAAGCGASDEGQLSARQASRLRSAVNDAREAADKNRCDPARAAAARGSSRVSDLPASVDAKLQDNLQQGFSHLTDRINAECLQPEATPTPTPSATATAAPTDTPSPTPTPSSTSSPTPSPTPSATASPEPSATPTTGTGGTSPDEGDSSDEPKRGIREQPQP